MSVEWLQKLPAFLSSDLGKFLGGAVAATTFVGGLIWRLMKAKLVAIEKDRLAKELTRSLEREREQKETVQKITDMQLAHASAINLIQEQVRQAREDKSKVEAERDQLLDETKKLQMQLAGLANSDGRQWQQDTSAPVPLFVSPGDRKTRFVSVINLKGGVGKTTLTANIGVTLARKKRSVLLVDLDF